MCFSRADRMIRWESGWMLEGCLFLISGSAGRIGHLKAAHAFLKGYQTQSGYGELVEPQSILAVKS